MKILAEETSFLGQNLVTKVFTKKKKEKERERREECIQPIENILIRKHKL